MNKEKEYGYTVNYKNIEIFLYRKKGTIRLIQLFNSL